MHSARADQRTQQYFIYIECQVGKTCGGFVIELQHIVTSAPKKYHYLYTINMLKNREYNETLKSLLLQKSSTAVAEVLLQMYGISLVVN